MAIAKSKTEQTLDWLEHIEKDFKNIITEIEKCTQNKQEIENLKSLENIYGSLDILIGVNNGTLEIHGVRPPNL